ncbi:CAP domain-containing protein [uncultured Roseobacter sp.]|uniref:CAP domain-containing protein n=1 Tax=uncultured Roseobacter sp. TaxID=114847 RepID=UPI002621DA6A|nr:CAP domain-containing protein [uncultured Roseobacter sp.]
MRYVLAVVAILGTPASASANTVAAQALNSLRADAGLDAVRFSVQLESAAEAHATDMAQGGFFEHTGSDGSDVAARVSRTGYGWCIVAENIAKGQADLDEVMRAWAGSDGHRRNMLSREVSEFALVQGPDLIWVMVLARPGC